MTPTVRRKGGMEDHRPPSAAGTLARSRNAGGLWQGTSRVVDRAARTRSNRLSWVKAQRSARRISMLARKVGVS